MKKSKIDELLEMRDALVNFQKSVQSISGGEYPYFYRMLDYMKNNIEIYLWSGDKDWTALEEILRRDWYEANNMWYGFPCFCISQNLSNESVELYYQYAILVQKVAELFNEL